MKKFLTRNAIYWFYRLLSSTWRVQISVAPSFTERFNAKQPTAIGAFHGDGFTLLKACPLYGFATMVSDSGDGDMLAYLISRHGGSTARGSSSKGGVKALKGMIRIAKSGCPIIIAVDGPRGPIHKVKPGIFELSRLCNAPIYAFSAGADRYWRAHKSWDQAMIPKPFAKVQLVISEAMPVISKEDDPKSAELADKLSNQILLCRSEAIEQL